MSASEIASESSPPFVFQYGAMVTGVAPTPASVPNFFPGVSRVLGCRRITAGGTVGQPYLNIPAVVAGASALPVLVSSSATDTSVYALYWTNEVAQSQLQSVLSC
jgi:hypothetical protein